MLQLFKDYISGPTHKWWVDNVWEPTYTKILTWIYGIPAVVMTVFQTADKWANDSTISQYMSQLNVPNWVPMGLAGMALIHYIASGHDD